MSSIQFLIVHFFNIPRPPEIYTLSLHDALPIFGHRDPGCCHVADIHRRGVAEQSAHRLGQPARRVHGGGDRKSTRLNSSHLGISYAVFCLKKKSNKTPERTAPARCDSADTA